MFKFINGKFDFVPNGLFTNENPDDNSGGGSGEKNPPKDPEWKSEFGDNFDADRAWTTIKNQRTAEAAAKKEKEALEKKLKTFEDANKTESEKLQARLTELETENSTLKQRESQRVLSTQIESAARTVGALYPEDVYALISHKLEISDDGKVKNLDKLLTELRETRPALFSDNNIDQHSRNNRQSDDAKNGSMNNLIRQKAGR